MKRATLMVVGILIVSAIPLVGGDDLFRFVGGNGSDASQFGFNVTYLGDINGDGYYDVAVGAPYNDSADGSRADCGAVYIFFGYPSMDLYHGKNIDVARANVSIYGANAGDHFGWSVADAGDLNGDGYDDMIVGAPDALTGVTERNGSAYVFYGKLTWSSLWDLSTTGADVTIIGENNGDEFGASVSGVLNISRDGGVDFIVGAPGYENDRGKVYVYSPNSPLMTDTVVNYSKDEVPDLSIPDDDWRGVESTLYIPDNGTIAGIRVYLHITHTYIQDLIVNLTHPDGTKLTLFCRPDTSTDNLYGWYIGGVWKGVSASADPLHNLSVFIGKYSQGIWTLNVSDYAAGDIGTIDEWSVEITYTQPTLPRVGERVGDRFGESVGLLGDIHGDAKDDFIVGAPAWNSRTGRAYVYNGTTNRANLKQHKYNFESGGGTDKWAYYDSYESGTFDVNRYIQYPPDTESTAYYSAMALADGNSVVLNTDNAVYWRFNFTIEEEPSLISKIYVSANLRNGEADYHEFYIWNYVNSQWELLDSSSNLGLSAVNGVITTNISDYIDPTGNVSLCAWRVDSGSLATPFGIDYIDIIVTYYDGMTLTGEAPGDEFGFSVSNNATNINGDGYNDVLVGAPGYGTSTGRTYVFYGNAILPSTKNAANADVILTGEASGDKFGYSVSGGSDIGGDGIPDIIIGAPYNDGKAADGGAVYVFNGSATIPSSISATNADYINYSANAGAHFGFSVSKAGDLNGDGFNDVIAGSPAYSSNSGRADILSCHKPPRIVSYDLQDSSGASKLNAQIDVNSEYHFIVNVTHPNGWTRVNNVTIRAWFDFGSESTVYNGTRGGNINLFMVYDRASGTFSLKWPTGGEVTLGTCIDTAIDSNTHLLEFYFTPGAQFRYAPGDGTWNSGPGLNDINSWNFEINVTDTGGWYDSVEDEFGVYRFTSVSASGNPRATGYPGLTYVMSPSTTVTYSSNADFRLNVSIDDLWNSANTASISAANVAINWTGHVPNSYVYFTGAGSPIWIFGSPSSFEPAPLNGTSQTITVYWRIDIPAGTLPDTYSSPVNYTISQN